MSATSKTFYFVNKDSNSGSFSRSEARVASEVLRHVQRRLWEESSSRRGIPRTTCEASSSSVSCVNECSTNLAAVPATSNDQNPISVEHSNLLDEASEKSSTSGLSRSRHLTAAASVDAYARVPVSKPARTGRRPSVSQPISTIATKQPLFRRSAVTYNKCVSKCDHTMLFDKSKEIYGSTLKTTSTLETPGDFWNSQARITQCLSSCLNRPVDNGVDPFASAASPITQQIHTCLMCFESLWISRSMTVTQSPGYKMVRESMSNDLQMACIIAAMSSRLENFHNYVIPGGSSHYMTPAIYHLRRRLEEGALARSEDVYAIMKLFVAEAYRSNIAGALVHLNGAIAAYEQFADWKYFDLNMASTLCGTGEAFFLPQVWRKPAKFNTIADPGPARHCFPERSLWSMNEPDPDDRLATLLISSFRYRTLKQSQLAVRMSILNDMLEYARIRQKMLRRTSLNQAVPDDVVRWAHLRRVNIVFRLLSIDTTDDLLSHCVRICLITWLAIVSDLSGFGRNLEIVAEHLRDVVQQLSGREMSEHIKLVTWMLFLGAVTGTKGTDGPWFKKCLAEFLMKSGLTSKLGLVGWVTFIETVNQGCFYCSELQRASVAEVASQLHLLSQSKFDGVAA